MADRPNAVWSWDITDLPTTVRGVWLYLYLVVDVWSRKVVAWDVAEVESAYIAAELVHRATRPCQNPFSRLYIAHSLENGSEHLAPFCCSPAWSRLTAHNAPVPVQGDPPCSAPEKLFRDANVLFTAATQPQRQGSVSDHLLRGPIQQAVWVEHPGHLATQGCPEFNLLGSTAMVPRPDQGGALHQLSLQSHRRSYVAITTRCASCWK